MGLTIEQQPRLDGLSLSEYNDSSLKIIIIEGLSAAVANQNRILNVPLQHLASYQGRVS